MQANDLTPIDSTVEILTIGFDNFGLASGETIASIESVTCVAFMRVDDAASTRLIGDPSIVASAKTGAASSAVAQQIGMMVAGVTYRLQCVVLTSQGNKLSVWMHVPCVAPS